MSAFLAQQAGNLGAIGVLAIVFMMIVTGRLVPRSTFKDMEAQRDFWQRLWQRFEQQREEELKTKLEANTEALRAVEQSFRALPGSRSKSP